MADAKTVVFGLDGAHFELIEPWIEAGHLPNVERVIEYGVAADLESVLPPVTSPNWKAYATGKNPGKIGIFWWENVDIDGRRVYYPSERKHGNTEFWELIADDEPVGVMGVPTTYPPKQVDEFLVAGAPDGEDDGFTYPPSLEDELEDRFDYRVLKRRRIKDDKSAAAEEILELIDTRFTAARALFEERDVSFLQATTFYINSLHHFLWDDDYTRQAWKIVDSHLGQFLNEGHNVVLMSDHGSNEVQTVFHINAWLEREGYLVLDTEIADLLYRFGMNTDRVSRIAGAVGIRQLVKRLAPQWVLNNVPDEEGELNRESKTDNVNWTETQALASGQGPIYLSADRSSSEYNHVREEIIDRLANMTSPDDKPIVDAIYRGEEVYEGPFLDEAPDIVIDQARGVHIPGGIGRESVFTTPTDDGWKAENKRHGLFAASGPAFANDGLKRLSLLDLAPTLLHLHDCPIPEDMDGQVQHEVFAPNSEPRNRDVTYDHTSEKKREIRRIVDISRRTDL